MAWCVRVNTTSTSPDHPYTPCFLSFVLALEITCIRWHAIQWTENLNTEECRLLINTSGIGLIQRPHFRYIITLIRRISRPRSWTSRAGAHHTWNLTGRSSDLISERPLEKSEGRVVKSIWSAEPPILLGVVNLYHHVISLVFSRNQIESGCLSTQVHDDFYENASTAQWHNT